MRVVATLLVCGFVWPGCSARGAKQPKIACSQSTDYLVKRLPAANDSESLQIAQCAFERGESDLATGAADKAKNAGDKHVAMTSHLVLADIALLRGDLSAAKAFTQQAAKKLQTPASQRMLEALNKPLRLQPHTTKAFRTALAACKSYRKSLRRELGRSELLTCRDVVAKSIGEYPDAGWHTAIVDVYRQEGTLLFFDSRRWHQMFWPRTKKPGNGGNHQVHIGTHEVGGRELYLVKVSQVVDRGMVIDGVHKTYFVARAPGGVGFVSAHATTEVLHEKVSRERGAEGPKARQPAARQECNAESTGSNRLCVAPVKMQGMIVVINGQPRALVFPPSTQRPSQGELACYGKKRRKSCLLFADRQ